MTSPGNVDSPLKYSLLSASVLFVACMHVSVIKMTFVDSDDGLLNAFVVSTACLCVLLMTLRTDHSWLT